MQHNLGVHVLELVAADCFVIEQQASHNTTYRVVGCAALLKLDKHGAFMVSVTCHRQLSNFGHSKVRQTADIEGSSTDKAAYNIHLP
jgi:hypothetical protein